MQQMDPGIAIMTRTTGLLPWTEAVLAGSIAEPVEVAVRVPVTSRRPITGNTDGPNPPDEMRIMASGRVAGIVDDKVSPTASESTGHTVIPRVWSPSGHVKRVCDPR
jgi:hypothetical protein